MFFFMSKIQLYLSILPLEYKLPREHALVYQTLARNALLLFPSLLYLPLSLPFLPPFSHLPIIFSFLYSFLPFLPFPSFLFHQKLYSLGSLSNKPSLLCTLPYLLHTLVRTSISKSRASTLPQWTI